MPRDEGPVGDPFEDDGTGDPWSPSSLRSPKPGEYDAWLDRCAKERERQVRRQRFESMLADSAAKKRENVMRPIAKGPTRFSTEYAIRWGKRQGWTFVDRERWNALTRRHKDLQLAVDVIFDDGKGGLVGVQGAGRHERARHWERFQAAGGEETAKRRGIRVIYLEFTRGKTVPALREDWA